MRSYIEVFCKYRFLLYDLISRDIKVKYRRSILGILWSVLNPLLMMLVITSVFQNIFKVQIENFPIYYLTGSTLFGLFSESTSTAMTSITGSAALMKKVYIPKYIFPMEKVLFAFVNFAFSLIAVVIMIIILRFPLQWTIILGIIPALYVLVFSLGVGLMLSAFSVFFRDIVHLYSVLLLAWQYLTPIMYPYEALPDTMKRVMLLNPMYYYINYFREVVMYGNVPSLRINLICIAIALSALVLGIFVFKKKQDRFILFI
ncbi:MAG: ABC transporter permease [Saccharofermentanales bacterium]